MRYSFALLLLCANLAACTLLRPEGTFVHGSVWLVSQTDIHQAIAAARGVDVGYGAGYAQASVDAVIVEDRSEMFVYFHGYPLYAILRRVDGRWQYVGEEELIVY